MKTFSLLLFPFLLFMNSCSSSSVEPDFDPNNPDPDSPLPISTYTGTWTAENGGAGGINNEESFKNFQFEYEVTGNNQTITYELKSSDLDVAFFLYKSNGEQLFVSNKGRLIKEEKILDEGTYKIVVMAERNGRGKFELSINALKKDIKRIEFNTLKTTNASWGELGGGALTISPKNGFYSFTVNEDNTFVDIEMESPDTEVGLFIYNSNNETISRSYGFSTRNVYFIERLNKGDYTVMTTTAVRNSRGKYQLNIYGKVDMLVKREYTERINEGVFVNGKTPVTYDFEITQDNSLLDVELSSPNYRVGFQIVDSKGKQIGKAGNSNTAFDIVTVQKGVYKLVLSPYTINSGPGNYKLITVGSFK